MAIVPKALLALALSISAASAAYDASAQLLTDPHPYEFPVLASAGVDKFPMPLCNGFKLEEASIDDIQSAFAAGTLTTKQVAQCYVNRIYQTNDYINSVVEINPDWETIAEQLDQARANGLASGPLHGIPFVVKENMGSKDKMETTAGSWALLGSVVPRDAHVVKQLREAGALLLGKATMSEWADMRSNGYSEGYSARGGQARSPYNFTVNPGGSSTGSATSVAANCITFSLGTETDGSVINPAMRNSLVGIKPTVGLTSRAGIVPETSHQDSVGSIARSVRDAVYALDAIYGVDSRDNYTSAQVGKVPADGYTQYLTDKNSLNGATFGIPWFSFWQYADDENKAALFDMIELLESAGATVINGTELSNYEKIVSPDGWDWDFGTKRGYPNESEYTVVKVDFYNDIRDYLAELENTNIRSLEDIVAYNYANDGTEGGHPNVHPAFESGQDGFEASLATKGIRDETYYQALQWTQSTTRNALDDALKTRVNNKTADVLLAPPDVGQSYQVAAQAGYPIVTVPVGVHAGTGMAFGLSIMGSAWSEPKLIRMASAIEDLQNTTPGNTRKRSMPEWRDWQTRNIPLYWDI